MDRFVAMHWDSQDAAREKLVSRWIKVLRSADIRWVEVLTRPGLRVFCFHHRGSAPVVTTMHDNAGIVIGSLFERGKERQGRVLHLDARQTAILTSSDGAALARDYWGGYVAIWRSPCIPVMYAMRDPCGAVPCFMTSARGIDLYFSHADDVADFSGVNFSIDWTYVTAFLYFNYFITRHTGLREVKELLAGQRLRRRLDQETKIDFVWDAAQIAEQPDARPFGDLAASARETSKDCFSAWGAEYRNIIVSLSGGLDSSVLVNLLRRQSNARITGVHYLGVGYERYEVRLAREAAAHAGVHLVEIEQDPLKDEVRRTLAAPRLARPKVQSLAVLIDDLSRDLADQLGSDCFMIGQGGDNLFLQRGGATNTFVDFVRLNGALSRWLNIAYDTAILRQDSVWQILRDAVAPLALARKWTPFAQLEHQVWVQHRLLAPDAARSIPTDYREHPWYYRARDLPPGKADHLAGIVALYNYYIHHGRGITRDVSYPFFSQPLVEFALRTPTYQLTHAGQDRAIERAAFADLLPCSILQRTSKGGANHYLLQVMAANRHFYANLIRDGQLRAQGLLDEEKINRILSPDFIAGGGGALFLYQIVAVEAWLHTWRNAQRAVR